MTVGGVVAFLAYASNFSHPVRDFSEKYTVLQQAMASVDRLIEISSHDPEPDSGSQDLSSIHSIEFKNVEFIYTDSKSAAVKNLNFKVERGEKIALLGETGSGKSTTCSLLMRFYEPTSGQIFINNQNLSSYSVNSLRAQMGWVSQDVTLFSTSLRENLGFYDSRVSDADIWEILELVQLKSWVKNLPNQLDETLSERGSTLSSGQRQLLSMARAIVKKPSLIIFDEATAYVDSRTEWQVQEALDHLWSSTSFDKVTGFFIAHRLSTLRRCNRMLVYRHGEIVENGTFEELMKLKGYAAHLYNEQFRKLA
jgi:ATP-binding cassette subfamily B protein